MENTAGSSHDKQTEFLTVKNSPRPGCNAATQTPQMTRHHTPTRKQQVRAPSPGSSSSDESLTYEDSIAYPSTMRSAAMPRGMPIPDVVIEYSKDTLPLTKEECQSTEQPAGITNLAFESKGGMVRSSSTGAFQQKFNGCHPTGPVLLQPNQQLVFVNNSGDLLNPSLASADRRLYYSLPRSARRKDITNDLTILNKPQTPQMKRAKDAAVGMDDSTFWIIPRVDSSNSLNTIPASASKYATPDSVSGLYTISGRSTVVTNGFSEPVIGLYEMHLVPPVAASVQSTPKSQRKFEFTNMPASVDRKRRRLQCCTDAFSLLLCLPGLLIAAVTPALVAPLFYVAPRFFAMHILIFLSSGTLAIVFLVLSGIVGNVVWHYDEKSKKLRPRMHCGKGPTFHFWGNGFYSAGTEQKEKEFIV